MCWNLLKFKLNNVKRQFYRVLVGLQSPEGNTTTRVVLRRFNDFLMFLAAVSLHNTHLRYVFFSKILG